MCECIYVILILLFMSEVSIPMLCLAAFNQLVVCHGFVAASISSTHQSLTAVIASDHLPYMTHFQFLHSSRMLFAFKRLPIKRSLWIYQKSDDTGSLKNTLAFLQVSIHQLLPHPVSASRLKELPPLKNPGPELLLPVLEFHTHWTNSMTNSWYI